jgi:hypothetical protein
MSAAVRNLIAPSDPTLLTTMVECGEKFLPRPWSRGKKLERTLLIVSLRQKLDFSKFGKLGF